MHAAYYLALHCACEAPDPWLGTQGFDHKSTSLGFAHTSHRVSPKTPLDHVRRLARAMGAKQKSNNCIRGTCELRNLRSPCGTCGTLPAEPCGTCGTNRYPHVGPSRSQEVEQIGRTSEAETSTNQATVEAQGGGL